MLYLLFFLSIVGWAYLTQTFLPRMRTGAALLCGFSFMCLMSYTGVILLSDFHVTPYIALYGGLFCLPTCAAYRHKEGRRRDYRPFFTWTLLCYAVLAALFGLLMRGVPLHWHDEYSFWARSPRELFLFERGVFNADTGMGNREYVPLFASLQFCVTKLFGWSNEALYAVVFACFLCCLCAVADRLEAKKPAFKCLYILLMLLLIPCCHEKLVPTNFMTPDGPLALLFGAGLLLLIYRRSDRLDECLPVCCALGLLPGVKVFAGPLLALALLAVLLGERLRQRRRADTERHHTLRPVLALGAALFLFVQGSWLLYSAVGFKAAAAEQAEKTAAFLQVDSVDMDTVRAGIDLRFVRDRQERDLIAAVAHPNRVILSEALDATSLRLFRYPSSAGVLLSWMFTLTSVAFCGLFCFLSPDKAGRQARYNRAVALTGVVYIAGFFVTLFVQPQAATSVNRYFSVLLLAVWMGTLFFILSAARKNRKATLLGLAALAVFLMTCTNQALTLGGYLPDQKGYDKAVSAQETLDALAPTLAKTGEDERVLLVNQRLPEMDTGDVYAYSYLALPRYLALAEVSTRAELDALVTLNRATRVLVLPGEVTPAGMEDLWKADAPFILNVLTEAGAIQYALEE